MKIETAKSILSTAASLAATAVVIRSIVNDILPQEFHDYLYSSLRAIFFRRVSSDITTIIEEFDGLENNKIFEAAELYIGARAKAMSSSSTSTRLKVRKPESQKQILVNVDNNEEIVEVFEGIKFRWLLHCQHVETHDFYNPRDKNATLKSEVRAFHLTFHKKFKEIAIQKYLPHILNEAELLKLENRTIKLYTIDPNSLYGSPADAWSSISLNHPATFETLALDAGLKKMIIEDIERFLRRKEYYGHVGKVWKRGYLLYGPPGTGKSTLIAALANYLNFDIYDLQLGGLNHDWELRKALVGTTNKSIVVVEDIDCSIEFKDRENDDDGDANASSTGVRENKVTLSGLLNFIDGLWSSCGDERIIIFTTNHKDKLDPALLRPGRMDMHIHMSFCNPGGFRVLAMNYLGLKDHELFIEIDKLIEEVEVTPAEIAEQLMRHEEPDLALTGLIDFLKLKKVAETTKVEEAKKLEDEPKSEGKVDDILGKDAQDANKTKLAG